MRNLFITGLFPGIWNFEGVEKCWGGGGVEICMKRKFTPTNIKKQKNYTESVVERGVVSQRGGGGVYTS